eukprot:jgi/Chrzof1/4208/Cz14g03050.t1
MLLLTLLVVLLPPAAAVLASRAVFLETQPQLTVLPNNSVVLPSNSAVLHNDSAATTAAQVPAPQLVANMTVAPPMVEAFAGPGVPPVVLRATAPAPSLNSHSSSTSSTLDGASNGDSTAGTSLKSLNSAAALLMGEAVAGHASAAASAVSNAVAATTISSINSINSVAPTTLLNSIAGRNAGLTKSLLTSSSTTPPPPTDAPAPVGHIINTTVQAVAKTVQSAVAVDMPDRCISGGAALFSSCSLEIANAQAYFNVSLDPVTPQNYTHLLNEKGVSRAQVARYISTHLAAPSPQCCKVACNFDHLVSNHWPAP